MLFKSFAEPYFRQLPTKVRPLARHANNPLINSVALGDLLSETIDADDAADRELVSTFTEFWAHKLAENLQIATEDQVCIHFSVRFRY